MSEEVKGRNRWKRKPQEEALEAATQGGPGSSKGHNSAPPGKRAHMFGDLVNDASESQERNLEEKATRGGSSGSSKGRNRPKRKLEATQCGSGPSKGHKSAPPGKPASTFGDLVKYASERHESILEEEALEAATQGDSGSSKGHNSAPPGKPASTFGDLVKDASESQERNLEDEAQEAATATQEAATQSATQAATLEASTFGDLVKYASERPERKLEEEALEAAMQGGSGSSKGNNSERKEDMKVRKKAALDKAHPNKVSSGELWAASAVGEEGWVGVDILLPNGLLVPLPAQRSLSLAAVKEAALREARRYPLYDLVEAGGPYVMVGVGQGGEVEELWDESRRLCDLRLFAPVLRLVEPAGNREENRLNAQISEAISRPLSEFARDPQLAKARVTFVQVAARAAEERLRGGGKDLYALRCDVIPHRSDLSALELPICVWTEGMDSRVGAAEKVTIKADLAWTPAQLLDEVLTRRSRKLSTANQGSRPPSEFLLKVVGRQLYLLKELPLHRFKYIVNCLGKRRKPELMVMTRASVLQRLPDWTFLSPSFIKRAGSEEASAAAAAFVPDFNENSMSLYELDSMFRLRVKTASHINITDVDKIYVKVGIFHGPEQLSFRDTPPAAPSNPRWSGVLEFDLAIQDIPHAAQICFAICSIRIRRQKEERCGLAWANLRLMDAADRFQDDVLQLHLWPFPKDFHGYFNPLGHNGSNPNRDTPRLEVEFERFERPVYFPPRYQILEYVERYVKNYRWKNHADKRPVAPQEVSPEDLATFAVVVKRDPLHEMEEAEKATVWKLREFCKTVPDSLPRLLDAVKWSSREEVAETWPSIKGLTGLELLDIRYPDPLVRAFAVRALDAALHDDDLDLYLLSLVQVLKYEPFVENELSVFLLQRALGSVRIGHLFFWLLKSELSFFAHTQRFTLLLEAYCRGCGPYLHSLTKQVAGALKLESINALIKDMTKEPDAYKTKFLQEQMSENLEVLENFDSPLDSSLCLGSLAISECRVMSSAKKPLWLRWSNPADALSLRFASPHYLIFKKGDDLRQDALTLQMLRIMDDLWKRTNLDFQLSPYTSLPMGKEVGMIEVVLRSSTIGDMQAKAGGKMGGLSSTLGVSFLNRWIQKHNSSPEDYEAAVERFTMSCAGYCVATFVLGIRDRHQDNIMVTEDGKIFHIDFGHFLGHYKRKWGISRERVPFVLTDHFITVIAKGALNPRRSPEFEQFMHLCGRAYMALHKHSRLFITLFTMMLCMGIPELQRLEDIAYLRSTLAVNKNEEEALAYFQEKFHEAYGGSWTTRTDWFFHRMRHATKT